MVREPNIPITDPLTVLQVFIRDSSNTISNLLVVSVVIPFVPGTIFILVFFSTRREKIFFRNRTNRDTHTQYQLTMSQTNRI